MKTYLALAVLGAMPIFLLVASLLKSTLNASLRNTRQFLNDWADTAPGPLRVGWSTAIGSSGGFALLVALAMLFNELGAYAVPPFAHQLEYFGKPRLTWVEQNPTEWQHFRDTVRTKWAGANAQNDPANKQGAKFRASHGKGDVRIPRTLFIFSLVLLAAGAIDIARKKYVRRGAMVTVVAIFFVFAFAAVWASRKEHYIGEVVMESGKLGLPSPIPTGRAGS